MREYEKPLPCSLTDEQRLERARLLALAREAWRETEAHRKLETKRLKLLVADADAEVDRLAAIVATGQEVRPVRVREELDLRANAVRIIRLDTGEEVGSRAATDADRQLSMLQEQGLPS